MHIYLVQLFNRWDFIANSEQSNKVDIFNRMTESENPSDGRELLYDLVLYLSRRGTNAYNLSLTWRIYLDLTIDNSLDKVMSFDKSPIGTLITITCVYPCFVMKISCPILCNMYFGQFCTNITFESSNNCQMSINNILQQSTV